jgi:hypothetical protein
LALDETGWLTPCCSYLISKKIACATPMEKAGEIQALFECTAKRKTPCTSQNNILALIIIIIKSHKFYWNLYFAWCFMHLNLFAKSPITFTIVIWEATLSTYSFLVAQQNQNIFTFTSQFLDNLGYKFCTNFQLCMFS